MMSRNIIITVLLYKKITYWCLYCFDILNFKKFLRVIFSENRESEDTHEKSIFLLFRQNVPSSELIQGKIV